MKARLRIREADGNIQEVSLAELASSHEGGEGIVIGRDDAADLTLNDPAVSRFHARLQWQEDCWQIRDLGSSNLTYVNGDPVSEATLQPGDQLTIGDSELQFIDQVLSSDEDHSQTQVLSQLSAQPEASQRAGVVLKTLYDLSSKISHLARRGELLDTALRTLVEGLGADRGAVLSIEGDSLVCQAAHSRHGQALRGFVLSQTVYREVMQNREAVLCRDTASDQRFQERASIVGEEIRAVLAAPIPKGDSICGILYLDRVQRSGDSDDGFVAEDLYGAAVAAEVIGAGLNASTQLDRLEGQRENLVRTLIDTNPIIGNSDAIGRVRDFIKRAAPTDSTVLVTGDTGTGKELVARAVHYESLRAGHPFIAINCAALPESLVESELFGHEKGAFTGAVARKLGKFEAGNKGTVFLDEIGELPLGCQSKLLRLLEERCFERVGGTASIQVDVRIVAATNRDLLSESEAGTFREDLFYRLNVLQIQVPPLKERPGDIKILLNHFLDHFSERIGGGRKRFSEAALKKLISYAWPGNVRQLRNTIESCVVMSASEEIQLEDLPIIPTPKGGRAAPSWLPRSLQEVEREHIERVLDSSNWNKSKSAEILGIERSTLYARIRNYEIKPLNER